VTCGELQGVSLTTPASAGNVPRFEHVRLSPMTELPQGEPRGTRRTRRQFGEDVLASAEADARTHGDLRRRVIEIVIIAIIGTGFGTLGLLKLFSAH
jgi:hypothetical protein